MSDTTWSLTTKDGKPVTNRAGQPFQYSTRELARIGKTAIQKDREETGYKVVEA